MNKDISFLRVYNPFDPVSLTCDMFICLSHFSLNQNQIIIGFQHTRKLNTTVASHQLSTSQQHTMNAPQYGKRLIPQVLDEIANTDPDAEIFSAPRSSDPKDGWKKVTYWQVANAVNRIAQLIVGKRGRPEPGTFPTLTYIGPSDVRYAIITIACIKAGYKVRCAPYENVLKLTICRPC